MVRRNVTISYIVLAILVLGCGWMLYAGRDNEVMTLGTIMVLVAVIVPLLYLIGPAAYLRVTPGHVEVGNPMRRFMIPRNLIRRTEIRAALLIVTIGGKEVPIRALDFPLSGYRARKHDAYVRWQQQLEQLMRETPRAGGSYGVVATFRMLNVALIPLSGTLLAAGLTLISK